MPDAPSSAFEIPAWMNAAGAAVERWPRAWIRLGNLETRILADEIAGVAVERPIYVSGLARSGTTILLELLGEHRETVSHAYKDFPFVPTPWFWNWFLERSRRASGPAVERAHGDGIRVTPDSPEALEEVLWMAFFAGLHQPGGPRVDATTIAPEFETFYREHLRKLLWMRRGRRYLAKGNYNVTRLGYLKRLFPDARFVVPIRDPVWHIASLIKQHDLFASAGAEDERVRRHLRRSGHFEFGLDRREINPGDGRAAAEVRRLWDDGEEAAGWAELWAAVYGHVADVLEDAGLAEATHIVRYEDFCDDPGGTIKAILDHCDLPEDDLPTVARKTISPPTYYEPSFSDAERRTIHRRTGVVAARFGYG